MQKVYIIYGGPSSEHDVSVNTARNVVKNLDREKYDIYMLYLNKEMYYSIDSLTDSYEFCPICTNPFSEVFNSLGAESLIFIAMHGEFGEDGELQEILEEHNVRFTGSGSGASRLCMNKYESSKIVAGFDFLVVPEMKLLLAKDLNMEDVEFPCVLKPNRLGSSVGLYFVKNHEEFEIAKQAVVEKFSPNTEFVVQKAIQDNVELSCGVLKSVDGEFTLLPPIEIKPKKSDFFDYDSKYTEDGANEIVPPVSIPEEISSDISRLARGIHRKLGCKVYSRSDFLYKDGKIYYLETNTLPGLTATSLLPKECEYIGVSYSNLLDYIIENSKGVS